METIKGRHDTPDACGYSVMTKDGRNFMIMVTYLKHTKKPSLVIREGNTEVKVATFGSGQAARFFIDQLGDWLECGRIPTDLTPVGLLTDEELEEW